MIGECGFEQNFPSSRILGGTVAVARLVIPYATRLSVTTGRCLRPVWYVTSSSSRNPGCPLISVCGLAQGEPRGQRERSSHRGARLAGGRRKKTSFGVCPPNHSCGRCWLYQTA